MALTIEEVEGMSDDEVRRQCNDASVNVSPGSSTEAHASGPQARRALTSVTELALVVLAPALH